MKLRTILSTVALSLLPIVASTQGCTFDGDISSQTDDATELTNYTIDFDRMNETYPDVVKIAKLSDPWTALVKVGDKTIPAPTHLFGEVVNIIPYSNQDKVKDATGKLFERGDQIIAKYFKPGHVGITLKMHRPERRFVDLNSADAANMKEDFKLQDTHIGNIVGVPQAEHGHPGAFTLNNPQSYEGGLWGDPVYSMIFLEPVFPSWASARESDYLDNIRTTLLAFNAVSNFPGDYNGGDPLGAHNPELLLVYVDNMVRAIAGDETAQAFFKEKEHLIYCAELSFIAFSGGLHAPLSRAFMEPRVGTDVWERFVAQVELHNKGVAEFQATGSVSEPSNFVRMNANKKAQMVPITIAPDSLRPLWELAPSPQLAKKQMALVPMTAADIVKEFMRTHIPRELLGESLAPVQAAVLDKMRPGLYESMAIDKLPAASPERQAVDALFDQIVAVVGTQYGSYAEFQEALAPLLEQARKLTGPRPGSLEGEGLFTPPSLFHGAAQGQYQGLIGFQYVGHGVHVSNTRLKEGAAPEPTPVEEIANEVSCNVPDEASGLENRCGAQAPGGCYCDELCSQYGDCCGDYTAVCR
jgi:hypothetical protein